MAVDNAFAFYKCPRHRMLQRQREGYSNCTFDFARDCVDLDAPIPDFATQGQLRILQQPWLGFSRVVGNTTRDALKFVIHFVGDIHQPLHCGMLADRGGVEINIFYDVNEQGSHWNLHQVWISVSSSTRKESRVTRMH